MLSFDSTRIIGWLSVFLLGIIIAVPYLPPVVSRRNTPSSPGFFQLPFRPMAFHYWLAPLLAVGSFVHAWIPMASRHMPRTNYNGLWLATLALLLILAQLGLGLLLRSTRQSAPNLLRRTHFTLMLGIATLVLLHLWLNSPMIHGAG